MNGRLDERTSTTGEMGRRPLHPSPCHDRCPMLTAVVGRTWVGTTPGHESDALASSQLRKKGQPEPDGSSIIAHDITLRRCISNAMVCLECRASATPWDNSAWPSGIRLLFALAYPKSPVAAAQCSAVLCWSSGFVHRGSAPEVHEIARLMLQPKRCPPRR